MTKKREAWHPAEYTKDDIRAIQALALYAKSADVPFPPGEEPQLSPSEAKRALDWIILKAAQAYDNGFSADDPNGRTAAFLDGRQSVAQQIIKLTLLKPEVIQK
jgi:hypothetical protein